MFRILYPKQVVEDDEQMWQRYQVPVAEFSISKIIQLQGTMLWSFFITFAATNKCATNLNYNYINMMKQFFSIIFLVIDYE